MITRQEFANIDKEIKEAIQTTLDSLKTTNSPNYFVFLADGEYFHIFENTVQNLNPFVIDNRMDRFKDETRLTFLSNFLTTFYSFPNDQEATDDNEQRIHMELMIYSHIWESKPFLKKLHRLAHISNGEEYNWKISVPDMGKHDFIRNDIRKTFEDIGNPIGQIIKNGFHTSLRNAFAHSDYSFDTMNNNKRIWLDNYNGENWELQDIIFDNWSKHFVYSALLSYHLLRVTHTYRTNLITDFGTNKLAIRHPSKSGQTIDVNIIYRQEHDSFSFEN